MELVEKSAPDEGEGESSSDGMLSDCNPVSIYSDSPIHEESDSDDTDEDTYVDIMTPCQSPVSFAQLLTVTTTPPPMPEPVLSTNID
jgi:hypothetical protein